MKGLTQSYEEAVRAIAFYICIHLTLLFNIYANKGNHFFEMGMTGFEHPTCICKNTDLTNQGL
ncbi:MAG: hypothetical protein LBC19_05195 [Tannerella sp.]|jgi:hypothetical protein|nr:hypothetical protein [Tannerella sp.]